MDSQQFDRDESIEQQWEDECRETLETERAMGKLATCNVCHTRHSVWSPCPDLLASDEREQQAREDWPELYETRRTVEAMDELPLNEVFSKAEIARLEFVRWQIAQGLRETR